MRYWNSEYQCHGLAMNLDLSHLPSKTHPSRGGAVVYERGRKTTLPVPDLRFEQSYLRSIKRYTYFKDSNATAVFIDEKTAGKEDTAAALETYGLPLRINWGGVLYLTVRDQVRERSNFLSSASLNISSIRLSPHFYKEQLCRDVLYYGVCMLSDCCWTAQSRRYTCYHLSVGLGLTYVNRSRVHIKPFSHYLPLKFAEVYIGLVDN